MEKYDPKSVLMTGCAGFIGSNVLCHLVQKYPDVKFVCYDVISYCSNVKNFAEIIKSPNFKFIKGDICSTEFVTHIMTAEKIDTVIHFAAETHVDNSFGNSLAFTRTNVMGTHSLLESAKAHLGQIRRFIHVSTDEVYGESQKDDTRNDESAGLNPTNPYAASKVSAEFMVKSYATSFKLPVIITRGNNVYGPKQYPEKLIPKFISLLKRGQPCPLHGDGSNRRSFLYVQDVAEAFDVILHKGKDGSIYNIGSDYEISNKEVLLTLLKNFNLESKESELVRYVRDRAFNDFRYHINTSSLEELGWSQKVNFDEGLKLTKEWYMAHQDYWGDIDQALQAHPSQDSQLHNFPAEKASDQPSGKVLEAVDDPINHLGDEPPAKKAKN